MISQHQNGLKRRLGQPGRFIVALLILLVLAKQIFVNAMGGERHTVAAVIFIAAILSINIAIITALMKSSRGFRVFYVPMKELFLWHGLLVFYWTILIFISNGGNLIQRVVASSYVGVFTLLIWVPVIFLTSIEKVRYTVRFLIAAITVVALIGILQCFIPESRWPGLLKGDTTVVLSSTLFGTIRSSGLIGTSLEFALLMSIMVLFFYIKLIDRVSLWSFIGFLLMFLGLSFAGSRAFWLSTAVLMFVIAILSGRKGVLLLLSLIVAISASAVIRDYFLVPFTTDHPEYISSVDMKLLEMNNAFEQIRSSPLIGTGLGFQIAPAFGDASRKVVSDGFWWAVLLEGGIVGLVLLFGFLGLTCLLFGFVSLSSAKKIPAFTRQLSKWGIAFIGVAVLGNFSNSSLNNQAINVVFYLMIGIVMAAVNVEFSERLNRNAKFCAPNNIVTNQKV